MNMLCKPKLTYPSHNSNKSEQFFLIIFISKCFLFFVSLLFSLTNFALEHENTTEISIVPFSLQSNSFSEQKNYSSGFFVTLIADEKISINNWNIEIAPEFRFLNSNLKLDLQPYLRSSIYFPERTGLNQWKVDQNQNSESVINLEKINFNYQGDNSELIIGRKPISLGVLTVFPVWNKFSKPFVTQIGPSRIVSQDQVSYRKQINDWSFQMTHIEQIAPYNGTQLAEITWYGNGIEIHTLIADWWSHSVAGVAASGDLFGSTLRFESIHINDEGWELGTGIERAFSETLSGNLEFLYLENGAFKQSDEFNIQPSIFRPLTAGWYGYARLVDKISDLTSLEMGLLENLIDKSVIVNPKVTYSASNDIDLSAELKIPTGGSMTEFNRDYSTEQFLASFRWVF